MDYIINLIRTAYGGGGAQPQHQPQNIKHFEELEVIVKSPSDVASLFFAVMNSNNNNNINNESVLNFIAIALHRHAPCLGENIEIVRRVVQHLTCSSSTSALTITSSSQRVFCSFLASATLLSGDESARRWEFVSSALSGNVLLCYWTQISREFESNAIIKHTSPVQRSRGRVALLSHTTNVLLAVAQTFNEHNEEACETCLAAWFVLYSRQAAVGSTTYTSAPDVVWSTISSHPVLVHGFSRFASRPISPTFSELLQNLCLLSNEVVEGVTQEAVLKIADLLACVNNYMADASPYALQPYFALLDVFVEQFLVSMLVTNKRAALLPVAERVLNVLLDVWSKAVLRQEASLLCSVLTSVSCMSRCLRTSVLTRFGDEDETEIEELDSFNRTLFEATDQLFGFFEAALCRFLQDLPPGFILQQQQVAAVTMINMAMNDFRDDDDDNDHNNDRADSEDNCDDDGDDDEAGNSDSLLATLSDVIKETSLLYGPARVYECTLAGVKKSSSDLLGSMFAFFVVSKMRERRDNDSPPKDDRTRFQTILHQSLANAISSSDKDSVKYLPAIVMTASSSTSDVLWKGLPVELVYHTQELLAAVACQENENNNGDGIMLVFYTFRKLFEISQSFDMARGLVQIFVHRMGWFPLSGIRPLAPMFAMCLSRSNNEMNLFPPPLLSNNTNNNDTRYFLQNVAFYAFVGHEVSRLGNADLTHAFVERFFSDHHVLALAKMRPTIHNSATHFEASLWRPWCQTSVAMIKSSSSDLDASVRYLQAVGTVWDALFPYSDCGLRCFLQLAPLYTRSSAAAALIESYTKYLFTERMQRIYDSQDALLHDVAACETLLEFTRMVLRTGSGDSQAWLIEPMVDTSMAILQQCGAGVSSKLLTGATLLLSDVLGNVPPSIQISGLQASLRAALFVPLSDLNFTGALCTLLQRIDYFSHSKRAAVMGALYECVNPSMVEESRVAAIADALMGAQSVVDVTCAIGDLHLLPKKVGVL
eukprot:PhM_4_TR5898/c0_g1_i1/m.67560